MMCGRYEPRAERKLKLYKLVLARSDIDSAGRACQMLLDHAPNIADFLHYPLLCAMCVCYAKPFVDSKGAGKLPKHWSKFEAKEHQSAHELMIRARHEIVAHNDPKARAVSIVPPGWNPPGTKGATYGVGIQVNNYFLSLPMLRDCLATCADLRNRLHEAVESEMTTLYGLSKGFPSEPFLLTFDEGL